MPYYGLFPCDRHTQISSGDLSCERYFLWRLPLWALLLCPMAHYDLTIGYDIARDIHCDVTMSNTIAVYISCYANA